MNAVKATNSILKILVVTLIVAGLVSCSPSSDKLLPKPSKSSNKIAKDADTFDPVVDILFVIDDSGSMSTHQSNLASNIRLFVDKIKQIKILDFHIGVTTTSVRDGSQSDDGRLVGSPLFVNQNTPNLDQVLYNNLLVGTSGGSNERPFGGTYLALTEPNLSHTNVGFYRPKAHLAIIYLTDTDDQSESLVPDAQFLQQFLFTLKAGSAQKIHTYGAIVPSTETGCPRESFSDYPVRIEEFFQLTGGISFSLCDKNFGNKIAEIGDNLVGEIARTMRLTRIPNIKSISVSYGTQIVPNDLFTGWVYNPAENAIVIGRDFEFSEQPPGTKLVVFFEDAEQ